MQNTSPVHRAELAQQGVLGISWGLFRYAKFKLVTKRKSTMERRKENESKFMLFKRRRSRLVFLYLFSLSGPLWLWYWLSKATGPKFS